MKRYFIVMAGLAAAACGDTGVVSSDNCGNGIVDPTEACDDSNTSDGDGCNSHCRLELGTGCAGSLDCESGVCDVLDSQTCEPADTCGNGQVESDESCDDGNTNDGDGCRSDCSAEANVGETCQTNSDCSSQFCIEATCFDPNATYLKASNSSAHVRFGGVSPNGIAVSGDLLAISAPHENSCSTGVNGTQANDDCDQAGAVYVFKRTDGQWRQEAYLKASNTRAETGFGYAIDLDGDTLVATSLLEASCANGIDGNASSQACAEAGAAYVFRRQTNAIWVQQAYVKAPASRALDRFGISVALQGDTLSVGCANVDSVRFGTSEGCNNGTGAVYIYERAEDTWSFSAEVLAPAGEPGDLFGAFIAMSGDTLAVAATYEDSCAEGVNGDASNNDCPGTGAIYTYVRSGEQWQHDAYLKRPDEKGGTFFGVPSLDGDNLVVGVQHYNACELESCEETGTAYVYRHAESGWSLATQLFPEQAHAQTHFGGAVRVRGNTIVVGAADQPSCTRGLNVSAEDSDCFGTGAAYVFQHSGDDWLQTAFIKSSNADNHDKLGSACAFDGDTLIVAAVGEDSCAQQIDGDQDDNDCSSAGAAYTWDVYE